MGVTLFFMGWTAEEDIRVYNIRDKEDIFHMIEDIEHEVEWGHPTEDNPKLLTYVNGEQAWEEPISYLKKLLDRNGSLWLTEGLDFVEVFESLTK